MIRSITLSALLLGLFSLSALAQEPDVRVTETPPEVR